MSEIDRAFGRHAAIHGVVSSNGGLILAGRRRLRSALTLAEREGISRGVVTKRSIRQIAAELGRAPSTVSSELIRVMEGLTRIAPLMPPSGPGRTLGVPSSVGSPAIPAPAGDRTKIDAGLVA